MHTYKNTATGAVVTVPGIVTGGDWVEVKPEKKKPAVSKPKAKNAAKK